MRAAGLCALALAAVLAACGQKQPEPPRQEAAPAPPSLAKATRTLAYTCEKDLPVTAVFGTGPDGKPDLALIVRGMDFRLTPTPAASGTRYATPDGMEPGMGLIWWDKGDEAVLQQAPSDKVADQAAGQTIRTCRVKTEQPAPAK